MNWRGCWSKYWKRGAPIVEDIPPYIPVTEEDAVQPSTTYPHPLRHIHMLQQLENMMKGESRES